MGQFRKLVRKQNRVELLFGKLCRCEAHDELPQDLPSKASILIWTWIITIGRTRLTRGRKELHSHFQLIEILEMR